MLVSEEEKAFGIIQETTTTGILLRNWLTYLLRNCIMQEEREAYHAPKKADLERIKRKFNQAMAFEIYKKSIRYKNENNSRFFDEMITHEGVLCTIGESGVYQVKEVFT